MFGKNNNYVFGQPRSNKVVSNGTNNNNSNITVSWGNVTDKLILFDFNYNSLSNEPVLFDFNYNTLSNKSILFAINYNSLSNRPVIPVITADTWLRSLTGLYNTSNVTIGNSNVANLLNVESKTRLLTDASTNDKYQLCLSTSGVTTGE